MKGNRLDSGGGDGGCASYLGLDDRSRKSKRAMRAMSIKTTAISNNSSNSLFSEHPHRPRPGHPLTLISFPSTAGSGGVFGSILTTKNDSQHPKEDKDRRNERVIDDPGNGDGWTQKAKSLVQVPKPSHSAKKLAKPLPFLFPSSAKSSSVRSSPFVPLAYAKLKRNPYFSNVFLGQEQQREEISPSAAITVSQSSSSNIDNKIGNKPKRHKTATLGLRKGVSTTKSQPVSFSFSSGFNKVVNSAGSEKETGIVVGEDEDDDKKKEEEQQQSDLNGRVMTGGKKKLLTNENKNGFISKSNTTLTKLNERLQVIRTQKEREESPESIQLNGIGLKTFPFIGGGEGPSLKLLSLQHNLINRIENVPAQLNHLVVLDLYDNRLERITGLQGLTSLRVLLLGKNRIRRIEGLEGLKRLEILDLHGNQLRYVDNLGSLSSLRILNLAGNLLRSIRNLGPYGLSSLNELNLKRNRIRNLEGVVKAPHLKKLLLANNDLQRKLVFLQEILLEPNPLCGIEWKSQVLTVFPWLVTLDRNAVTDQMRFNAKTWHKRRLVEEEARKKEEERLRIGSPTRGPPGSREQVIYQARRRWESVKNFVKNSTTKATNPLSEAEDLDRIGIFGGEIGTQQLQYDEDDDDMTGSKTDEGSFSFHQTLSQRKVKVLEYPGGEIKLELEPMYNKLVSSSVMPGDLCPPSMINDCKQTHKGVQDYVNTNIISKQLSPNTKLCPYSTGTFSREQMKVVEKKNLNQEEKQTSLLLLSSQSRPRNEFLSSSITNKIIKEGTPSFETELCQQPGRTVQDERKVRSFESTGSGVDIIDQEGKSNRNKNDDDDRRNIKKSLDDDGCEEGVNEDNMVLNETSFYSSCREDKSTLRIAVVRPLVREQNFDETISSHPLNTNSSLDTPHVTQTQVLPEQIIPSISKSNNGESTGGRTTIRTSKSSNENNTNELWRINRCEKNWAKETECDLIPNFETNTAYTSHCIEQNAEKVQKEIELNGGDAKVVEDLLPNPFILGELDSTIDINKSPVTCLTSLDFELEKTEKNMDNRCNKNGESVLSKNKKELRPSFSTCNIIPTPSELHEEEICTTSFTSENDMKSTKEIISSSLNMKNSLGIGTSSSNINALAKVQLSPGNVSKKVHLRNVRSTSFDGRLPLTFIPPQSVGGIDRKSDDNDDDYDDDGDDDDDTCSIATSTNTIATTSDASPRGTKPAFLRNRPFFPRTKSQRLKLREKIPRAQSSSSIGSRRGQSGNAVGGSSGSTFRLSGTSNDTRSSKNHPMRRCDSAVAVTGISSSENHGANNSSSLKKQGTDYLVEIDGKVLSIFGQGALKHTLTGFTGNVTCSVTTAKFHYISYDSIIPYFGKLRQIYPSLEHFQFRANNITTLSQLNALSDLQGLTSIHVAKEGNPLVSFDSGWIHYSSYRLSHWGLLSVNGKEVSSEYRGGQTTSSSSKCFESLGFLALSCLPQTALTPLAKRLHMLHCFCCCSPSSSSDDSGRGKMTKGNNNLVGRPGSPSVTDHPSSSSGNICTSWDDDPVLLDVIGKEALVYCPVPLRQARSPPTLMEESSSQKREKSPNRHQSYYPRNATTIDPYLEVEVPDGRKRDTLYGIADSGIEILEKLDMLEKVMPSLMTEMIQDILTDYMFMDNYMKKEMKKCQDAAAIDLHGSKKKSSE